MRKILAFILAVLFVALSVCGCKKTEPDIKEDTEQPTFSLKKEDLGLYSIVIPEGASKDINKIATDLKNQIARISGADIKIKGDFVAEGSDVYSESEYEILIGRVNRTEMGVLYEDIRENDSGYAMVGKKLALIGCNAEALQNALNYFVSDVLYKANTDILISDGESRIVKAKYTFTQMTINGVNIKDFKIIYPSSSRHGEKELAASLRLSIRDKTGYTLTCESDKAAASAYEIQIGDTNRITGEILSLREASGFGDGKYSVCPTQSGVWLSGNTAQTLNAATVKFFDVLEVKGDEASFNEKSAFSYDLNMVFLSALTYNVYHKFTSARNADDVLLSIAQQNTDIFGCNEANAEWMTRLTARFDSTYTCVKGKNSQAGDAGDYCPIFFKTDKLELVEWGTRWLSDTPDKISKYDESHTQRIITYAILKDKETSIKFMYVQAHLENNESGYDSTTARKKQSAVLKSFTDAYSLPIIIGGDCNTTKMADLSPLLSGTRFENASTLAKEKKESGTWVGSAFEAITGGVLDYFFVTEDTITVNKYEAVDNKINGKYPSDHIPVRIDAVIYQ